MNKGPVAWINLEKWKDTSSYLEDCVADMKLESTGIVTPLYTHPAKTLTDEEIMELWYPLDPHDEAWVDDTILKYFARAILRKAQEK